MVVLRCAQPMSDVTIITLIVLSYSTNYTVCSRSCDSQFLEINRIICCIYCNALFTVLALISALRLWTERGLVPLTDFLGKAFGLTELFTLYRFVSAVQPVTLDSLGK